MVAAAALTYSEHAVATKKKPKSKPAAGQSSHRKAVVFVSLVGVLTGTTALLLALSPAPLQRTGETLLNQDRTSASNASNRQPSQASLPATR